MFILQLQTSSLTCESKKMFTLKLQLSSKCEIIAISKAVFFTPQPLACHFFTFNSFLQRQVCGSLHWKPSSSCGNLTRSEVTRSVWTKMMCLHSCLFCWQPHVNPQISFVFTSCFPTQTQLNLLVHDNITNGTLLLRDDLSGLVFKEGHTHLGHEKVWWGK